MTQPVGGANQPGGPAAPGGATPAGGGSPGSGAGFDRVMADDQAAPAQADAELSKRKDALDLPFELQVDRMPLEVRLEQKRELEARVQGAGHEDRVQYFATKILGARDGVTQLDSMKPGLRVPEFQGKFVSRLEEVSKECNWMEGVLKDLEGGKQFSMQELLTLQIRCHQVTQSVELLTKSVEHGVGGLKQIYQTNV